MKSRKAEWQRRWKKNNREAFNKIHRRAQARRRQRDRLAVLTRYGGSPPKCARCGFRDMRGLTVDHINGGGVQHRVSVRRNGGAFYRWICQKGFPPGLRILCANCQMIVEAERRPEPDVARRMRGNPPYGYDRQAHHLVVNQVEAEVVRLIYESAGDGLSLSEIASKLNMRKARTKLGGDWSRRQVHRILNNPIQRRLVSDEVK